MHAATAPILYSEIVVDNPAGLLKGIDRSDFVPSAPDSDGAAPSLPIHKSHSLAQVSAIHYIHSAADRQPYGPSPNFPSAGTEDEVVAVIATLLERYDFTRFVGASSALASIRVPPDEIFPRLQRRTIFNWNYDTWLELPAGTHYLPEQFISPARREFETHLSRVIPIPLGRFNCLHFEQSPYFDNAPFKDPQDLNRYPERVEINVTHRIAPSKCVTRNLMPGINNVHFVAVHNPLPLDPGERISSLRLNDQDINFLKITISYWKGIVGQDVIDRTRITVFLPRQTSWLPSILAAARGLTEDSEDKAMEIDLKRFRKQLEKPSHGGVDRQDHD